VLEASASAERHIFHSPQKRPSPESLPPNGSGPLARQSASEESYEEVRIIAYGRKSESGILIGVGPGL
jgi:hypothetical protein